MMTVATARFDDPALTTSWPVATAEGVRAVPGRWRRAVSVTGDVLAALALALCVPYVLLAIGLPIVLGFRLLLWVGGLF